MNINEFVANYDNHPVLFIGTGLSLRYLNNSFTWDQLLSKIAFDLYNNDEKYLDIKHKTQREGTFNYPKIASILEQEFNEIVSKPENRNGKFKVLNDIFYEHMRNDRSISRFKLYIAELLNELSYSSNYEDEIKQFKKIRKNIASVITTNYDSLVEDIFEFVPLIGNDILLSNPYGSVYKIHGSVEDSENIIISESDYSKFNERYELIRAQLLSIFIHNPIIFLGYSVSDDNIKSILRTIFTYVQPNSMQAEKIRSRFLLVEYEQGSDNENITSHDIQLESNSLIRINQLKTDNYSRIYEALSKLNLPVSAMDIRKVQNIVKEINAGGNIKVQITEDLDGLENSDKILVIGSSKTIKYEFQNKNELMANYYNIIDESNEQILTLVDKHSISKSEWFPIFGFKAINKNIDNNGVLQSTQIKKVEDLKKSLDKDNNCQSNHKNIEDIFNDDSIVKSRKYRALCWSILNKKIDLSDVKDYLLKNKSNIDTEFRKLLCIYDYMEFYTEKPSI